MILLIGCMKDIPKGGQVHLYMIKSAQEKCKDNGGLHYINHKYKTIRRYRKSNTISSTYEYICENGAIFVTKGDSTNYELFLLQFLNNV